MSEQTPDFSALFKTGKAPHRLRLAAAKGLVPMALEQQILTFIRLTADPDRQVSAEADKSIEHLADEQLLPLLKKEDCPAEILSFFCFSIGRIPAILEAIAMNNSTPDTAVAELGLIAETAVLQIILFNQVRLIRFPAILDNIFHNPQADITIRRRVAEIRQEFFEKTNQSQAPAPKPSILAPGYPASLDQLPSLQSIPEWVFPDELPPDPEEEVDNLEVVTPHDPASLGLQEPDDVALYNRIRKMTTSQKIKRALLGNKEERSILIRETNRMVATSVLKSPKISEQEVDGIASMRNVSEEILRMISLNRNWIKNYSTVSNLVKNPKTPIATALNLIPRLMEKEIRFLAKDRSISDTVRKSAQRILHAKGASH